MTISESGEKTIDLLTNPVERSSGYKLIKTYIAKKVLDSKEIKTKINLKELWRDALKFYKISVENNDTLYEELRVEFEEKPGTDVGVLSFDIYLKQLISSKPSCLNMCHQSTEFLKYLAELSLFISYQEFLLDAVSCKVAHLSLTLTPILAPNHSGYAMIFGMPGDEVLHFQQLKF